MKKATAEPTALLHCLIHPDPGCFGEGGIWPPALELHSYDGTADEVRAALAPEYVVVRTFPTLWQAQYELGVQFGN